MKQKPLVYIAGPYRSDPVMNTRKAVAEGMALWRRGSVAVLIPHLTIVADLVEPMSITDWYSYDFDIVPHCDVVYRLPGESRGADKECELARIHKIPVFTDAEELLVWAQVWAGEPPPLPDGAPELRTMPHYMMERGDMVWHPEDRWFYRCVANGAVIGGGASWPKGMRNYQVAIYPSRADDWNRAQRMERLS